MSKIDLSPECVEALQDMQNNSDTYAGMMDFACDFIIESANTNRADFNPGEAMVVLQNLRSIRKVIKQFENKEDYND